MKRVIAVVGMHRCGTSAMTRALGYLGVGLGDTFIDAMPEVNAKGFWEDADFNRLNIAVLRQCGCDWLSHRPIAAERFAGPALQPLAAEAERLLNERLRERAIFAFKDPRTTLLLPFWQGVFARAEVADSYLVAIRHPAAVADSLARRNGFDAAKSRLLWLRYTVEALQKSALAGRRVLVDYDVLMDDPVHSLRRIARELELPAPGATVETEFSKRFLSAELRHSRPADSVASEPADMLHAALLSAARGEAPLDSSIIDGALKKAAVYLADCAPLLAYLDSVEQAAALGSQATEAQFPWLHTLRMSFGVVAPAPHDPVPPAASWWGTLLSRLRGHQV